MKVYNIKALCSKGENTMKKILAFLLASIMLISLIGCFKPGQTEIPPVTTPTTTGTPTTPTAKPVSFEVVKSNHSRILSPDISDTQITTLVKGNNEFAFDLYQALRQPEGKNIFYSPYSISIALAMTYAGARGDTEKQMADTLHYLLSQDILHPAINSLDLELTKRGEEAEAKNGEGFRLNLVNAIWGQKDYQFLDSYLDTVAENYGAGLRLLDFVSAPEESRVAINDWVNEQTEGRIKDLLRKGIVSSLTRLVLTNAIYFNAAWQYPFDEKNTTGASFRLLDGRDIPVEYLLKDRDIPVDMMHLTEEFNYAEGNDYQAIELKYDGGELSMVVLLPKEGNFYKFKTSLDAQAYQEIISAFKKQNVLLSMPKFEYESEFSLIGPLAGMGMTDAFSTAADFSGMTGNDELFIKDIVHKAFVSVDEAGTEASAATAVIIDLKGMPGEPVKVTLDRPFIYLIRDVETGTILFMGNMMNPA